MNKDQIVLWILNGVTLMFRLLGYRLSQDTSNKIGDLLHGELERPSVVEGEAKEALLDAILEWRDKYRPLSSESLLQMDSVNLALPELAEAIFEIVGYHQYDDEDEDE